MKDTFVVPLTYQKVVQSKGYTLFILGNDDKKFGIYTSPHVGETLQGYFSDEKHVRPSTHQLLQNLLMGVGAKFEKVVIYDVQEAIYFAKMFLEVSKDNQKTVLEIDARPSDCLALALMNKAPIFCTEETMKKATAVEEPQ